MTSIRFIPELYKDYTNIPNEYIEKTINYYEIINSNTFGMYKIVYEKLIISLNDILLERRKYILLKQHNNQTKEPTFKEKKTKKKAIPSTIKKLVWNTYIGEDIGKAKCVCCKSTDITQISFNCGHIIAESKGGETKVSNLKPICQNCNSSMGTKNMNDFMLTLL